eukprot:Gb_37888 [translate_table: standard]
MESVRVDVGSQLGIGWCLGISVSLQGKKGAFWNISVLEQSSLHLEGDLLTDQLEGELLTAQGYFSVSTVFRLCRAIPSLVSSPSCTVSGVLQDRFQMDLMLLLEKNIKMPLQLFCQINLSWAHIRDGKLGRGGNQGWHQGKYKEGSVLHPAACILYLGLGLNLRWGKVQGMKLKEGIVISGIFTITWQCDCIHLQSAIHKEDEKMISINTMQEADQTVYFCVPSRKGLHVHFFFHSQIVTSLKNLHFCNLCLDFKETYLRELVDVRTTLAKTQESADASAVSAQSVQFQCSALLKELDKKNNLLQEHENRVTRLGQQLDELQQDLKSREISQRHLKEEVLKIEQEIKFAVAKAGANKDCELRKLLDEVSAKNFENLAKHLSTKEEEIARLREEIKIMSAQWKQKTQELEAQLEKQRRADQELKKRVLKLEFCLQEARSQTRKLQRIGERRDKAIKELREQLQIRENGSVSTDNPSFWESSGFKFLVSMSMVVLVVFAKR